MQIPATTETFLSIGSGGGPGANTWLNIRFQSGNDMWCNDYTTLRLRTTQVFRDPAAWYHLVFRCDTTLGGATNRFRLYVNGIEVTSFVTQNTWSQNDQINLSGNGYPFLIGQWNSSEWFNGYISEFVFLDGYSAPPSDFGTEDSNGVWIPKDPTDTVTDNKGTNGFWLDFADSSALGNDVSGNNHDFTATSMSADNWSYDRPADDSDTKTGNIILSNLKRNLTANENNKKIKVVINSSQSKIATTKSSTGKATAYKIKVESNIEVIDYDMGNVILADTFSSSLNYKVQDQYSETINIEEKTLKNILLRIHEKIIIKISKISVES